MNRHVLTVVAEKKGRYTNKKSRIIKKSNVIKKIELITKKIKLNINNLKLNINIIEINNSNRRNYRRSKTVLNQVELFVLTIFLDLIIINT